jgi:hypothetical protein
MLSKKLSTSRKFADVGRVAGEFPQLLYPLLVAHCDDFGRQPGDAFTVKHEVFPTSPRAEIEFESALVALEVGDMIQRYHAAGRHVIQVLLFEPHQQGLHKRTESEFPAPPPHVPGGSGIFRENSGNSPLSEEKRREPSTYGGGEPPRFPQAVEKSEGKPRKTTWQRALAIAHGVIEAFPDRPDNWSPELKTRLQEQHFDPRERGPRGGQLFHDALEFATKQKQARKRKAAS